MQFNSTAFLLFFPACLLTYYIVPQKCRRFLLLGASYYFYMCWNAKYFVLILFSTLITYFGSLALTALNKSGFSQSKIRRYKKLTVACVITASLGILFIFKYSAAFLSYFNALFVRFGASPFPFTIDLLLPVGISFYTFQSISYMLDVYRAEIAAERRFVNYALFVSFFPQLVAGPIERSSNLLPQLNTLNGFDYSNFTDGLKIMVFGFFQKVVIADRVAVMVNTVYNHPVEYHGAQILLATLLFAVQIYCDFAGYSNIAIGAARCMGIHLMRNFATPYFALSIKEFWRRWHISLSTWFKDYLYFPLGGSRCSVWRANCNLLLVFTISGLWHGAALHFLVWGVLHGVYQVVGNLTRPFRKAAYQRLRINEHAWYVRACKLLCTFTLVSFAWIFFRANSISDIGILLRSLLDFTAYTQEYWQLTALGLSAREVTIALCAIVVLLVTSVLQRKPGALARFNKLALPVRWAVYLCGVFGVLAYGYYGPLAAPSVFVYFQF